MHPGERAFLKRLVVLNSLRQSHIDYCSAAVNVVQYVHKIRYDVLSDHASLGLLLGHSVPTRGGGVWCLNAELLKEEKYMI